MAATREPGSRAPAAWDDRSSRDGAPTPWYRTPWPWAFLTGVVCLTLIRPLLRHEPPPPPVLLELPRFELVSDRGTPFGSEQLAGRVWIAHFFFTRCVAICPRLVASVGSLRKRLDEAGLSEIHIVGLTVDPAHDVPEQLRAYAAVHEIDPASWTLLTGAPDEVRRVVVEGFRVPMGELQSLEGGLVDVAHTGKLVLVDGAGGIRGYYDTDALGLDEVFHRAQHVLKASR